MKGLFKKKTSSRKTLYLVDPADGFVKDWHVNRIVGYEPQVRLWLSQLKMFNLKTTPQVEQFFEGLHINREDHDWQLDTTVALEYWGGQYLFVQGNKESSVVFGQYQEIKDRCDRVWPRVGLEEEDLDRISKGTTREGMLLIGLGARSVDSRSRKDLRNIRHTLVGAAICEPIYLESSYQKLRGLDRSLRIITSYDKGVAHHFAKRIEVSISDELDGRALPELPEDWTEAVEKATLYYYTKSLDRLHIVNALKERFEVKILTAKS